MKKKYIVIIILFGIIISGSLLYINNNSKNNIAKQNNNIQKEEAIPRTDDKIPEEWKDDGIFTEYYNDAYDTLNTLTLEEKIGQIFLVRYSEENAVQNIQNYNFSGYIFFEKDFKDKTKEQVISMMNDAQNASKIPLITAVDEEGGSVVRVSSNKNLASNKFKSPQELYKEGGFELIKQDTIIKSNLLYELGINLNLAPVVDISTNKTDYMYKRTLGENKELTSEYAKTVINASKNTKVSYCLKHFPGYGNNIDTHKSKSIDTRTFESIMDNDCIPFKAGIDEKAECVLVSHNIVTSIDSENPATLSKQVHKILRENLGFTGVIITDDLAMEATKIENATEKAVLAGNDLIIVTDYEKSINEVKSAIEEGRVDTNTIDKMTFKILAWKYYKGLMDKIY